MRLPSTTANDRVQHFHLLVFFYFSVYPSTLLVGGFYIIRGLQLPGVLATLKCPKIDGVGCPKSAI